MVANLTTINNFNFKSDFILFQNENSKSLNPKFIHFIVQKYLGYNELSTLSGVSKDSRKLANHDIQWKLSLNLSRIHTTSYIKTNAHKRNDMSLYDQTMNLIAQTLKNIKFNQKIALDFYAPLPKNEIMKMNNQIHANEDNKDSLNSFLRLEVHFASDQNKTLSIEEMIEMEPERTVRHFLLDEEMPYTDPIEDIVYLQNKRALLKITFNYDAQIDLKKKILDVINPLFKDFSKGKAINLTSKMQQLKTLSVVEEKVLPRLTILALILLCTNVSIGLWKTQKR